MLIEIDYKLAINTVNIESLRIYKSEKSVFVIGFNMFNGDKHERKFDTYKDVRTFYKQLTGTYNAIDEWLLEASKKDENKEKDEPNNAKTDKYDLGSDFVLRNFPTTLDEKQKKIIEELNKEKSDEEEKKFESEMEEKRRAIQQEEEELERERLESLDNLVQDIVDEQALEDDSE